MAHLRFTSSNLHDGSMKTSSEDFAEVFDTRKSFLSNNDIDIKDATLVRVTYDGMDYCRYITIHDSERGDGMTRHSTIKADALVTAIPGHALFLPLADCVGAVIHDPNTQTLMVSHLGRHNLEQFGGTKCVEYLVNKHRVDPRNLTVWLSPAAGQESYPLYAFNNRSLHDVATEQLLAAGIRLKQITASLIDSALNENYFSHSQFLKCKRQTDGRFAIVTVMA